MNDSSSDILIIGGGLTGLLLTNLLKETNYSVILLEARDRVGGRILTQYSDLAPLEMGATWLGKKHTALSRLLQELNIPIFEQTLGNKAIYEPISTSPPQLVTLPPNSEPSYRIKGGSSTLIDQLFGELNPDQIYLNAPVSKIIQEKEFLSVKSLNQIFKAKIVVSTLPPYLFSKSISTQPTLPQSFLAIANHTHTWMGESIKISLTYQTPFWRKENLSGTIFSNVGPIPEMYDHANFEDSKYALKGFLNGSYFSLAKEERLSLILQQLEKYYGDQATDYISYEETVWRNEPFTYYPYESNILPHQNNGHDIFQQPFLGGKLFIAGSETAAQYPGYMEGCVRSAHFIYKKIGASFRSGT